MREFHCFFREQLPVPGSPAQAVRYPACEWREAGFAPVDTAVGAEADVVARHPMNRFLCSWLTSDMADLSRCDEVLRAISRIEAHQLAEWFADGDAFQVDIAATGVQFNTSNVGPEDTRWWNLPEGRFDLADVKALLGVWRNFLARNSAS
jgi:hypothetical protein